MAKMPLYRAMAMLQETYRRQDERFLSATCELTAAQDAGRDLAAPRELVTHWSNMESTTEDRFAYLVNQYLPSGSGIDCGSIIKVDDYWPNRIVIGADYHHMDEHGGYDGWSKHTIVVTASLSSGFDLRVTGKDRNDTKDYLACVYHEALSQEVDPYEFDTRNAAKAEI